MPTQSKLSKLSLHIFNPLFQFVVGCDSGALQVISVKKCTSNSYGESAGDMKFEGEGSMSEHNDMILDIDDLGSDGLHFVTCSQDKRYLLLYVQFVVLFISALCSKLTSTILQY